MIDLHTHSTASDGVFSPSELVKYAFSKGVSVFALTDHDTVAGLEEAKKACKETGITFVPGIEINIDWPTGEFHLLGEGLKNITEQMQSLIKIRQESRHKRNLLIIEKMKDDGYDVSYEELASMFNIGGIGRPHFAAYMVQKGIVKNNQAAFDKYLAKGRPWYSPQEGVSFDDAVSAIVSCGGIPILAHPMSLYISWGKIKDVIVNLQSRGLKGLEAWHPGVRVGEAKRLEALARELGLCVTAGSDFHGKKVRPDREIGHTCGGLKIEDRFWTDDLEPLLNR